MRLRNVIKVDTDNHNVIREMSEIVNKGGDAVIMPKSAEHEKVELSTRDLILKNMELIDKLIDSENKNE